MQGEARGQGEKFHAGNTEVTHKGHVHKFSRWTLKYSEAQDNTCT